MKKSGRLLLGIKVISDAIAVAASWILAGYLRFYIVPEGKLGSFELFLQLVPLIVAMYIFFISRNNLYVEELEHSWRKETANLVKSSFQAFLLLVITLYFLFSDKVSRIAIAIHFCMAVLFLVTERALISSYIREAYAQGKFTRRILLVGFGDKLTEYEKALHSSSMQGIRIVGQYDGADRPLGGNAQLQFATLRDVVTATDPDLVVICYPGTEFERQEKMVAQGLDLLNEKVVLLPSLPESYIGTKISDFRWIPMLHLNAADIGVFQRILKRLFDVVVSSLGILVLSPLLLLLTLVVKLSSPGPIIYKQRRITRNEEVFTMYKFRSMRSDLPEDTEHWTEENDPRVTKIGSLMRKTSLDELPQLFNVLGGSMSLVGPRPERPELVSKFNGEIPGYRMRHRTKAGISGWAQVNGWRGNTSLERRIEFDLYYIRNWSFLFDLKIVLFTFLKGFVNENAY